MSCLSCEFLSTPSARRATADLAVELADMDISIHALREEGDAIWRRIYHTSVEFLSTPSARRATYSSCFIRPSCEFLSTPSARRATKSGFYQVRKTEFLSTPSARRATSTPTSRTALQAYFYPRPPRGGRLMPHPHLTRDEAISIHALREEGDLKIKKPPGLQTISIHALREEGDPVTRPKSGAIAYFYPRPPRGGRRTEWMQQSDTEIFLSTPSARRATCALLLKRPVTFISIHALREEGDTLSPVWFLTLT